MNELVVPSDPPPEPRRPRLPWVLVLALVFGGVALGYLLGGNLGATRSPADTNDEISADQAPATSVAEQQGLLIPGYRGPLAALLMRGGRLELAVWGPFATEPHRIVMGAELFNSVNLNSTRSWAAALSSSGAASFLNLGSIQTPIPLEPYQEAITSFAWHVVNPAQIAWTQMSGERTVLVSASPSVVRDPTGSSRPDADTRAVADVAEGWAVRAYADGWYLLQGPDGLVTLDEQGVVLGSGLLDFAAAGPSGALLLHSADDFTWTDPKMESLTPAGFVPRGVVFSPDGEKVAYLERDANGTFLRIASIGGPVEVSWGVGASDESRPLAVPMEWTFDGFVLMPSETMGRSYVMALNIDNGVLSEFGVDGRVVRLWGSRGIGA